MSITTIKNKVCKVPPGQHICPDCKGTGQRIAGLFVVSPGTIGPGYKVCRRCCGVGHLRGKEKVKP